MVMMAKVQSIHQQGQKDIYNSAMKISKSLTSMILMKIECKESICKFSTVQQLLIISTLSDDK
jgi:hypothetical protein